MSVILGVYTESHSCDKFKSWSVSFCQANSISLFWMLWFRNTSGKYKSLNKGISRCIASKLHFTIGGILKYV